MSGVIPCIHGIEKYGVPMMREAFSPGKGPLADLSADSGEQVARMELFTGAIGSYKNPQSHREIDLNDPVEAPEIILFATRLLRIVDARVKGNVLPNRTQCTVIPRKRGAPCAHC